MMKQSIERSVTVFLIFGCKAENKEENKATQQWSLVFSCPPMIILGASIFTATPKKQSNEQPEIPPKYLKTSVYFSNVPKRKEINILPCPEDQGTND